MVMVIIVLPPGVPVARIGSQSASKAMVGVIDESGLLPGSMALATPPTKP